MPNLPPHANETNTVLPNASAQQNTRALLRSLEELRDSLSTRVEQLSTAVERLRGQAGQLERALEGDLDLGGAGGNAAATADDNAVAAILGATVDVGGTTGAGTAVGTSSGSRESRDPLWSPQRARNIVRAYENRPNPSSPILRGIPDPSPPTHQQPGLQPRPIPVMNSSSISAEMASLNRPITSEDITTLLDRASQPIDRNSTFSGNVNTSTNTNTNANNGNHHTGAGGFVEVVSPEGRVRPTIPHVQANERWLERAQTIENRIRRLSETARELRTRASLSLADGETERSTGLNRLLSRVREDHDRLEAGLRRLDENGVGRRSDIPGTHVLSHAHPSGSGTRSSYVTSSGRTRSRLSPAIAPRSRSGPGVPRSRGLPPTNTENVSRQPSPLIVRSLPASPASTIRPELEQNELTGASSSDVTDVDQNRVRNPTDSQANASTGISPLANSLLNQPVPASTLSSVMTSATDDSAATRMRRSAAPPPPPVTHLHLRPGLGPSVRESPDRTYRGDDGMTYRGMTVASRMSDQTPSTSTSTSNPNARVNPIRTTWPSFGNATASRPTNPSTNDRGLRLGLDGIPESHPLYSHVQRFQSALDAALANEATERSTGIDRAVMQEAAERFEAGSRLDSAFDNLFSDPANNTARVIRIDNLEGGTAEGEEVWVVDMTVEPAQAGWERGSQPQTLTSLGLGPTGELQMREEDVPRPRPAEEAERIRAERLAAGEHIRAERQAADERIEQSRAALRRVQELRRELGLLRGENRAFAEEGRGGPGGTSGGSSGMDLEVDLEVGVQEPGLTPTQGISAASARDDGEIDLMRHLIIDTGSSEEGGEGDSDHGPELDGGSAGTVFEGQGQRNEALRPAGSRQSDSVAQRRRTGSQSQTCPAPQPLQQPPKESFNCDIDLWPTLPGPAISSSSSSSQQMNGNQVG
ncbi:hypothetical protein IAU59_004825 [Kwoniella sp. CBS 9459]